MQVAIERQERNLATLLYFCNEVWQAIREAHAAVASRFPQLTTPNNGGSGAPSPRACDATSGSNGGGGFGRPQSPTGTSEWTRTLPETPHVVYAEELYEAYPTLDRKAREEATLREHGAIVLVGIGAPLGYVFARFESPLRASQLTLDAFCSLMTPVCHTAHAPARARTQ